MFPKSSHTATLMVGPVHHLTFLSVFAGRKQTCIDVLENAITFCTSTILTGCNKQQCSTTTFSILYSVIEGHTAMSDSIWSKKN